jgi:GH25 family lysozyme M1 (1,4-beta-N-acetylmuramidase)
MNKKILYFIIGFFVIILLSFLGFKLYNYLRIKYAHIEIVLKDDLTLEFNDKKKVSDFIESINGTIIDDYIIDSTVVGDKEITFDFINDQNIKLKYSYNIKIVDTVKPLIWLGNRYSVAVNSDIDLTKKILCGDNYDSKPNCFIEGSYDLNTVGEYELSFKAIDSSGNTESKEFILNVYEPVKSTDREEKTFTYFEDVVSNYKNNTNKIGLDISSWQGDIDFALLKEAGVEFVIIRVGGTRGTNGEYFLDKNFKQNIENANKYDIDVGIYFYSYANTIEQAKNDAKWVLKQIKNYKVNLPIAFDWEEWNDFNEYNLSFFGLTSMADVFLKEIENAGYEGMLYSSKTYLENIWMPIDYKIWLAQYNYNSTYEGNYYIWQMCDNGKVNGIDKEVDIDILYME